MGKGMKPPERRIQNVFVMLLLAVFAGSCILVALMGAQAYRNAVVSSEQNNSIRVLSAIIRGAVSGEDEGYAIIEKFDEYGITSLTIVNDYDGDIYYRRLYLTDGWMKESFTSAERGFSPDMGDELFEAQRFEPKVEGNLLTAEVTTAEGETRQVYASLRVGGAAE